MDFFSNIEQNEKGLLVPGMETERESNWDNDFILQLTLLPKCLLKVKTAKNVLFIGKCLKVIQTREGLLGQTCKHIYIICPINMNYYYVDTRVNIIELLT